MLSFLLTISLYCDHVKAPQPKIDCFNKHLHCLNVKDNKPKKGCVVPKIKENKWDYYYILVLL